MQPLLVSAGYDQTVRFWDLSNGCNVETFVHADSQINSMAISPSGHHLAVGGYHHIRLYDIRVSLML